MSENDGTQPQNAAPRYAKTGVDKNRMQLEKLMKDPSKPVVLPAAPKEKTVRAPREMIKNVQGSSAGAGSGEFHVYKASRRREYERLKIMEDQKTKEEVTAESERRRKEREEEADAKTAKNRAKRQKRKEAARMKGKNKAHPDKGANDVEDDNSGSDNERPSEDQPFKKRRLVAPEVNKESRDEETGVSPSTNIAQGPEGNPIVVSNVVIHDED
ncbi:DUF1168-domain-containing protein [Serendipita vermifera]|nr:DUF1168-domain-containing protein [Serendipita vermifera]